MNIKPPSFWYNEDAGPEPLRDKILDALSRVYLAAHKARQSFAKVEKCGASVICIGNLNAGGAGKTPTAIALMHLIKTRNLAAKPFFLTRGYGGLETGPLVVDTTHTFTDIGDEPLLLAQHAPTVVSLSRPQGAALAVSERADLVLMDDGLQNPNLYQEIKLIVIDGSMGFGNGKLLPAGPLREPLEEGLNKADAFIFIGEDKRDVTAQLPPGKPIFKARLEVEKDNIPQDQSFIAFAGLAYPEKFFMTLRKIGLTVLKSVPYPDHYPYKQKDIRKLRLDAAKKNAALITTEKDSMRLPKDSGIIHILRVQLKFEDETSLADFLKSRLTAAA